MARTRPDRHRTGSTPVPDRVGLGWDRIELEGAKKIVAAVDGSFQADQALTWAAREAQLRSGSLTVLHVYRVHALTGPFNHPVDHSAERDAADAVARGALDRVPAAAKANPDIVVFEVTGRAIADAVLHNTRDADLVVLGSRGLGGFEGLLLGSVSYQVAAHSRVPVAVIPYGDPTELVEVQRVVVGVDGSAPSRMALRWGAAEAAARDISLLALNARRPVDSIIAEIASMPIHELQERARVAAREALTTIVEEELGGDGTAVEPDVGIGNPAEVLMEHAARPSSLLVIGSRGRGGVPGMLLGSVSQQCLTHARGPVVVVHAH